MHQSIRNAFTLIELLVVITIIVVLLALLVPAMDKAIYQAELAVCSTKLRSISVGVVGYAMNGARYYPHRPGVKDDTIWPAAMIYNGSPAVNAFYNAGFGATDMTVFDDRRLLRTFISLNDSLNDPLTGELDFDDVDFDCTAYSTYNLWFGYGFTGHRFMRKVGDRWGWKEPSKAFSWRFSVLAADRDTINGGAVQTSHPDSRGVTANTVVQNGFFAATGLKFTISIWTSNAGRGLEDLNFANEDGSVQRLTEVGILDSDVARVPESNRGNGAYQVTMPPQR